MAKTQLVSIVVPVFNEEDGIAQLKGKLLQLRGLLAHEFDLELIFVDDGSHDRTVASLREQFSSGQMPCQVIEHRTNQGVGAAFRTGFKHSNGALICTID